MQITKEQVDRWIAAFVEAAEADKLSTDDALLSLDKDVRAGSALNIFGYITTESGRNFMLSDVIGSLMDLAQKRLNSENDAEVRYILEKVVEESIKFIDSVKDQKVDLTSTPL